MRAAGFVLTGGNSSRMGSDKALLTTDGRQLVQQVATALEAVANPVALVGKPERYARLPWRCLPDLRPGLGPLAGLEAALAITEMDLNLVVACDMPGLQTQWLRRLLEYAERSEAPCVVTRDPAGKIHPLCAVYRRGCLPFIRQALDTKRHKLTSLIEELGAEYLVASSSIHNLNTPLEWLAWLQTQGLPSFLSEEIVHERR